MSRCPRVLISAAGTVPLQWGGRTPRPLRDAPPWAAPAAGVPGPCPKGPSRGVGSRAWGLERRKDGALGASEMLPSARGGRRPGGRHDALS